MSATTASSLKPARPAPAAKRGWWRSPWLVPLPGFILLALLSLPPFLYAVYLSFVNIDVSLPNTPLRFVWFQNYAAVLGSANGLHALLVTLIVSFGSTLAAISVGLLIAYLIHLYAGRLSGFVTILVLIPLAVSPVAHGAGLQPHA